MLKIQHPTDYLTKEGEVAEQIEEEQSIEQVAKTWKQAGNKEDNKGLKRPIEDLFSDQELLLIQEKKHKRLKRSDDQQPGPSIGKLNPKQQSATDYNKVNERSEEFVKYFVKEFEAKLRTYHMVREGELKKEGRFSDKFSKTIGGVGGGVLGSLVAPGVGTILGAAGGKLVAKAGVSIGKLAVGELGSRLGSSQYMKKVISLADLIDLSQKDKANFRKKLVKAGFDVFQSFEMQFIRVTTSKGPKDAMHELAKDATNRAINYMQKNKDTSISEGAILGKSKKEAVHSISSGFEIKYEYSLSKKVWNTASLYDKAGVVIVGSASPSYYKKKEGKSSTTQYGYRRLLAQESWEKLKEKYDSDNSLESKSVQFTGYQYILSLESLEEKSQSMLDHLKSKDESLGEERIREVIVQTKNDILGEINVLKRQSHGYAEDRKILANIEANLKKLNVDEYLKKFEQYLQEIAGSIVSIVKGQEESKQILGRVEKTGERTEGKVDEIREGVQNLLGSKRTHEKEPVWFNIRKPVMSFTALTPGRQEKLDQITSNIQKSIVVISGLGGLGKSELARRYVNDHGKKDYDSNVIWINAKQEDLSKSFKGLAKELGIPIKEEKRVFKELHVQQGKKTTGLQSQHSYEHNQDYDSRINFDRQEAEERDIKLIVKDIYKYFKDTRSLFIFDSADGYNDIKEFLPSSLSLPPDNKKPDLLITSNTKKWDAEEEKVEIVQLGDFTQDEAKEFIEESLKIKDNLQQTEVQQLAEKLQFFPLALRQAVVYIQDQNDKSRLRGSKEFKVSDYLREYDQQRDTLLNYEGYKDSDHYTQTVLTTWKVTLKKIESDKEHGEQAKDILNIMAYLDPDEVNIKELFLRLVADEEQMWKAVELLNTYSMVNLDKGKSNIHRLVQEVIRLELKGQEKEEEVLRKALELIKSTNVAEENTSFISDHNNLLLSSHVVSIWKYARQYDELIKEFIVDASDENKGKLLLSLIQNDSLPALRDILEYIEKNHPNKLREIVNSALLITAYHYNSDTVQYLIDKGADFNAVNNGGITPLHLAAYYGNIELVIRLIKEGASVDDKTYVGDTPLHLAIKSGKVNVVETFVKQNAKINVQNDYGMTPLHVAALNCPEEVVNTLLKGVNDPQELNKLLFDTEEYGMTPLHYAALNDNEEVINLLLNRMMGSQDALKNLISQKNSEQEINFDDSTLVKNLLLARAAEDFINNKHHTILHVAVLISKDEVIKLILDKIQEKNKNIKPYINKLDNEDYSTPLMLAIENRKYDVADILLEYKADLETQNKDGCTVLSLVAKYGDLNAVEYLINKGAKINAQNNYGMTPLHVAAWNAPKEVVSTLLEGINDPQKLNKLLFDTEEYGMTPLHYAALNDNKEVINLLLNRMKSSKDDLKNLVGQKSSEQEINFDDHPLIIKLLLEKAAEDFIENKYHTILHEAVLGGKEEVIRLVLEKIKETKKEDIGQYINKLDNEDYSTPLMLAIEDRKANAAKILLEYKAGLEIPNKDGRTVLSLAAEYGDLDAVEYLVDEGADVLAESDHDTVLHQAVNSNNKEIVRIILDKIKEKDPQNFSKHINAKDTEDDTPLMWAAQYGKIDVVEILLEYEANVNAENSNDETALHWAAKGNHWKVAIVLLRKNANLDDLSSNQKQELLSYIKNKPDYQDVIDLLQSSSSKIHSNKKQQKAFVSLGKFIDSHFPDTEVKAVKQGLYLPSFESRNVQINGKCAAITRVFSQGLFLEQQGEILEKPHELFLNNLQTSAELYERIAQGKQISSREEKEIFALSRLLDNAEQELTLPTSSLPSHLSPIKSYKTLDDLSHYVSGLTEDFAIHLVTSNHVVAIYRTGDTYTYFDSNVAFVSDLKSVDQLMKVVEKGVKYAGYELAEEGFLVEHFDVEVANNALTTQQKEILEKPIQTERHLLSLQDQEYGPIDVDGEKVSRVTLYDMGAKLHVEGSAPVLINSEMSSEDLTQGLSSGKVKITAREYLQKLKGNSKEFIQEKVKTTSSLPFSGSINEVKDARTIQDLVLSENGQKLNSYELNKILKGPIDQSIKALPYYMEVANTKHWPNRLTNAAGRISMAKGFYDIAHSIRYGDTEGFLLGSGEIGFSLFSQLIEDGIVKVTPQFIKQMKHGIFLSRGFAGMISSPFDIYDLIRSSIDLAKAEKGSKEWRDSIAGVVLSGTSVTTSIAFTALGKPGVGTVVGLGIIIGQGFYSGTSMVIEYKKYKLTTNQEFRLFWHTFTLQLPPEDVQYLAARKDVVNKLAKQAWEYLQNNTQIAAYAMGLGEIRFVDNTHSRFKRMIDDMEQSIIGAKLRNDIYIHDHQDVEEAIKEILPKSKEVEVDPSSASIGMLNPSNERNGQNLSRIVPVSPSPEAQMLCLPQFSHRNYEYDNSFGRKAMYSNSSTAIYNCRNAMIVGRKHDTRENPVMVFDLNLVNGTGLIVSSSQYRNQFNIAQGEMKIYGGNYTSNVFTLTNDNFFGTVIGGIENATNVLDASQLKSKGLSYENNIITTQEAQMTAKNINHFIGRNSADEHVDCHNMNKKMIVDSRGGNDRNSDVISNCKQVVVTGNTKVVSNEPDNTFYIKPSNGYAEINGEGKGFIIFSDTALLEKASDVSYSATNNTLSLQINIQEDNGKNNGTFTLDINNYLGRENNHNYVLIDKYGSVIEPLIQPNSTEVTNFNLKAETNLTTNAEIAERYKEISQTNNNYTVYGVIRDLAERYTIFGSKDSDVIPLTKNVTFAQGNGESDVYSLIPDEQVNVTINNYDEKKAIDMLYLPMDAAWSEAEKVENNLHISTGNATINVENYFRNSSYRHLTVIDKDKNTFLPWSNNQSLVQLVPFFHATKDQYMFLLSAEKVKSNPEVIVDAKLDYIRFYRDGNDLVLIDDKPLIVKVENFYGNQYGNFTLNFRDEDKLSSKQLFELAKIAINYQDEIRSTYYESVREYVNPSNSSTIHHNQKFINGSLTTVEPDNKRVGILVLQDPSDIEVSANNNDLVFFVAQSNATFVIKNWNDTDHRISMLKFGDEDKSIEVRGLDKFDLSEVSEIQSLIDKATISNTLDEQLDGLDTEVVNGLKYLLASNGIVNKVNVYDCLGFDSEEDQQEFVAAYSTLYNKEKLKEVLQDNQTIEALRWLITKGHVNLSLKNPGKEKLKDLDQCFGAKNNFTIKNGNDRVSVLKFNQSIEVDLSEVSEIQHLIGKYGISNTANQQLEKLGNEVVNDFKYLLVSIDIENGIDVYNCLAEKGTQKILNPYYYEWVNWNFVKDLIEEKKVDVNTKANDGNTLLHEAASSGNLGIVTYLIDEKKVDVNSKANDGRTPLHHAAASGSLDLVKYLVDEKGVNVNTKDNDGKTSLHYAAYSCNLDLVKYLVDEKSVDINTKDNDGNTILHDAVSSGNLDLVKYLIEEGADVNTKTKGYWTPLHKAAEKGNEEIVLALLNKGVDVNARTNGGYTPLHWAALSGNTILALLNNGANVNARTDDGETPLHLAASKGNKEAVLALLNKGADVKAKDDSGWTPLRTAEHHGKGEIVVLLNHQTHQRSRRAINEENIASSATRVGSRINDLFGWVKSSIGGLFNSKAALPENNTTQSSLSQVDAQVNVDGTIMLLDFLIRKVTGQKHIPPVDKSISLLEAQGYALNITTKFEQVLNETAFKSGISVTNLNFNPVAVQSTIVEKIISGKFSKILETLCLSAEKACPEFKQTDKFLACLKSNLKDILDEKEVELLAGKQRSLSKIISNDKSAPQVKEDNKPNTFLNDTSISKGLSYAERVESSGLKNGVRIG